MTEQNFSGVSPVGRMLSGAIFEKTTKGFQGKEVAAHHYLQMAIPKTDQGLAALFANLTGAANAGFFNQEQNRTDFAWKFKDGDAAENSQKEGWAGCFIFTFKTGFDINSIVDATGQNQIIDPNKIKAGYQIRVAYSVKANGDATKPGVYLNFNMVQLVSIDKEIQTGPSAAEVFAAPAAAIPMQPGAVPAVPGPMQQGQGQGFHQPPQGQPMPPPQGQQFPTQPLGQGPTFQQAAPMQQAPPQGPPTTHVQAGRGPVTPDHTILNQNPATIEGDIPY